MYFVYTICIFMIKLGELFCGPGGFAEGAKNQRVLNMFGQMIFMVTLVTPLENIHPKCEVIEGDVYKKFIKQKMIKLKKIDGLIFGFPCNDFSIVGKTLGLQGSYGPLYKANM